MALEEDLVGRLAAFLAVEEVVERHFVERGGRGVGRDVPADAVALLVRPHDHRHRVPADDALDAALDLAVAGIVGLLVDGNRVDVGRGGRAGVTHAALEGSLLEPIEQKLRPPRPAAGDHVIQRVEPFGGFLRVVVRLFGNRKRHRFSWFLLHDCCTHFDCLILRTPPFRSNPGGIAELPGGRYDDRMCWERLPKPVFLSRMR